MKYESRYDLRVGSVVYLISGGPRMTVTKLLYFGKVSCRWFNGLGVLQEETFPSHALKVA